MDTVEYLGLTRPVSLQEPTAAEKEASAALGAKLEELGVFESPEGHKHRHEVITFLDSLVKQWVAKVTKTAAEDTPPEGTEVGHGARLLAFGGQQLGVVSKGSDIDLVCIVPRNVTRGDFFTSFLALLKSEEEISKIRAIQAAYVPIISLTCRSVEVDMCLSCLTLDKIHEHLDITDNGLLQDMDPLCIRSVSGVRETLLIQELVPDIESLREVVRAIKVWAKAKGLNGTGYGYPSGIAWTVMAARVCQMYPTATSATLLHRFFTVFSNWIWPQPVRLKEAEHDDLELQPWNPKINPADRFHLMPVITPAYPEHNATFVVTPSTLAVFKQQAKVAAELTEAILNGKASWEDLFQTLQFLRMHKHFLMVCASANNDQDLLDWSGMIESRLRNLVSGIESAPGVCLVHPWPCHFKDSGSEICRWFIGLELEKTGTLNLNLVPNIKQFTDVVYELAQSRGLYKKGMKVDIRHVRRKDIKQLLGIDDLTSPLNASKQLDAAQVSCCQ